jgi:hypothetical protein
MMEKFQTLEVRGRKSSKPWKFFAVLFPMLGSLAFAQGPGSISQGGFFQAWWGAIAADPYERLLPTAYWYPSADLNNTDRILGIASTNTVNTASISTNGWEFNGTSQFLDMGRPTEIEPGTNLTYSFAMWIKLTGTQAGQGGLAGKVPFSNFGDRWGFFFNGTTNVAAVINKAPLNVNSTAKAIPTNVWHKIAFTLNRAVTNGFIFYVDGQQVSASTFTNTNSITFAGSPNTPFNFGRSSDFFVYYRGYIDQAAVWNGRALTSNEVFDLFEQTRSGRK